MGSSGSDRSAPVRGEVSAPPKTPRAPSTPPAFVKDPVVVDYSLIDKTRTMFDSTPVHFEQARDEIWAPKMESTLQERLNKDVHRLVPEAKVEVSCRTISCLVELSGVPPNRLQDTLLGLQATPVANILQFSTASNGNPVQVAFFPY